MSKQPYFFKKQGISIAIEVILLFILYALNANKLHIYLTGTVLLITLDETFAPFILKRFHFTDALDAIFYYLAFYYHIVYIRLFNVKANYNILIILVTLIAVVTLVLVNFKDYKTMITGIHSKIPIKVSQYISIVISNLIAIVAEEILFRMFLLNLCVTMKPALAIILSSLVFTFSHYVNRWANVIFKLKNYFFIFILGIVLAIAYIYTKSLLLCIILHFVYNSSDFLSLTRRVFRKEKDSLLFNDYK